jgi:glutamate formiminotransferase
MAVAARDRFARWLARTHGIPVFRYGPLPGGARTLPEVRRDAFGSLAPDDAPPSAGSAPGPHPRAGATAAGARHALVAYNVWVADGSTELARRVAAAVRRPGVRALGFDVGGVPQVSLNLTEPFTLGPGTAYDLVAGALRAAGARAAGGELVGLVPARVLDSVPRRRWEELGLDGDRTIEARLSARRVSWR